MSLCLPLSYYTGDERKGLERILNYERERIAKRESDYWSGVLDERARVEAEGEAISRKIVSQNMAIFELHKFLRMHNAASTEELYEAVRKGWKTHAFMGRRMMGNEIVPDGFPVGLFDQIAVFGSRTYGLPNETGEWAECRVPHDHDIDLYVNTPDHDLELRSIRKMLAIMLAWRWQVLMGEPPRCVRIWNRLYKPVEGLSGSPIVILGDKKVHAAEYKDHFTTIMVAANRHLAGLPFEKAPYFPVSPLMKEAEGYCARRGISDWKQFIDWNRR